MKKLPECILTLLLLAGSALPALSQATQEVPMADAMRSNGKIYVVVAVLVVIFLGIVAFLVRLERRLNKWERQQKS